MTDGPVGGAAGVVGADLNAESSSIVWISNPYQIPLRPEDANYNGACAEYCAGNYAHARRLALAAEQCCQKYEERRSAGTTLSLFEKEYGEAVIRSECRCYGFLAQMEYAGDGGDIDYVSMERHALAGVKHGDPLAYMALGSYYLEQKVDTSRAYEYVKKAIPLFEKKLIAPVVRSSFVYVDKLSLVYVYELMARICYVKSFIQKTKKARKEVYQEGYESAKKAIKSGVIDSKTRLLDQETRESCRLLIQFAIDADLTRKQKYWHELSDFATYIQKTFGIAFPYLTRLTAQIAESRTFWGLCSLQ